MRDELSVVCSCRRLLYWRSDLRGVDELHEVDSALHFDDCIPVFGITVRCWGGID